MRALLIAAVLLVGCDDAPAASVGEAPAAAEPARVEAQKACSAITGYRPGGADRLRAQEYADCVDAVSADEARPESEPSHGLRGRTEGPA